MIITISGKPGSGKSTVARILSDKFKLEHYSTGDFRRERAKELDMTLEEYNKLGEKDAKTDREADEWQKNLGKKEKNFIIDGRLSYHFIPHSIKIFLNVSPEAGAERIMLSNRPGEKMKDIKQALKMWHERTASDLARYEKYYHLNPYDLSQYDFVLDTSKLAVDEAVKKIEEFLKTQKTNS
jgi:cytidylate kinase